MIGSADERFRQLPCRGRNCSPLPRIHGPQRLEAPPRLSATAALVRVRGLCGSGEHLFEDSLRPRCSTSGTAGVILT